MNKKKRIAILFAVILVVAVGIIIAVTSHQKKEMDFDEFADRFEKSAEEVLGEDVKKVTKTELAATLTYGDQTDKDRTIYYRILKNIQRNCLLSKQFLKVLLQCPITLS